MAAEERRERNAPTGDAENDAAGEAERRDRGWGGLDGQAYRRRVFNSVHVGELWFEGGGATEGQGVAAAAAAAEITARYCSQVGTGSTNNGRSGEKEHQRSRDNTVTVLLPVRNGGDQVVDALESVLSCARELPSGWDVDVLIVDDGSEDGAVDQAVAAVTHADAIVAGREKDLDGGRGRTSFGSGSEGNSIGARGGESGEKGCPDAEGCKPKGATREGSDSAAAVASAGGGDVFASYRAVCHGASGRPCPVLSETGRSEGGVVIRVLRHERSLGLAESLNEGLREARGDLVARMDADDVCMPDRLKQQVLSDNLGSW